MPDSGEFDGTAIVELPLPNVEGGENAGSSTMVGNCTRCAHAGAPANHNATSALAKQPKIGERIAFKLGTEYERWDSARGSGVFKAAFNSNPRPDGQGQQAAVCYPGCHC